VNETEGTKRSGLLCVTEETFSWLFERRIVNKGPGKTLFGDTGMIIKERGARNDDELDLDAAGWAVFGALKYRTDNKDTL